MKNFSPLFILFFTLNLFSQKEANFWYFGNNAALDFNSGTPVPVSGSQLNTLEGCSSFADADGNLLFYVGASTPTTNNLTIWNKNNTPMPNGIGLEGDSSSSQSALTVPAPGKPNIYYLFTVGAQQPSNNAGFWYYTIDMSLNGGLGEVVAGPQDLGNPVDHSNWSEKVTAVRAKDCNTFWVISAHGNNFYAYKVDDMGVNVGNPTISTINGYNASADPRGYLKVSPDGSKLVSANMSNGAYLFDFNDETGEITNFNGATFAVQFDQSQVNGDVYGVEFSASSRRLYLSTGRINSSNENLYQIDLTQPTIEDMNNSVFLVHTYFNSRGALQLGPDGKIYWTSNESNFISVINNPEKIGRDCDYSHLSVKVGDGSVTASQGLPPFLSSLLLPIEITDADTNTAINNQDLKFCIGQDKTIVSEIVTGSGITYEWNFDNGTRISSVSSDKDLSLTNIMPDDAGSYTLTVKLTDDCGNVTQYNATFNVNIFESAAATQPSNIDFCDVDRDGFNEFDLQADKTSDILNGQDPTIFEVLYYTNLADATSGDNPIANPYTNPTAFSRQTIFARVQNKNASEACFEITSFELNVNDLPVPTQPTDYRICDDTASGSDTDGIIETFLLSSKDSEILGSLDASLYNITYHTTLTGAQTDNTTDAIDKNTNRTVTNSERIFVRIENVNNTSCNAVSNDAAGSSFTSFQLIVDPLPVLKANPELDHCVALGTTNPTVNLTLAESSISDTPNVRFEYYVDAAGTNRITDETAYPVMSNTTQSVFVRVISNQDCARDLIELKINVGETPDNAYDDLQPPACDDFLDADGNDTPGANDDTDFITNFVLDKTSIENEIKSNLTNPINIEIKYFENETDRNNTLNEIDITNYRNDINKIDITTNSDGIRFPIYYKILSTINNNCQGLGEFYLQINAVPTANPVTDLELCDDGND
ncbi:PKD domain-containing protein, partial [Polaribacter aestuariivivens]|uniref:PKD domain-containing protein n=1 Tax=Polaribacter aestuariivivens TaxID=2304626 RepID=UPI003F494520